ncbi:MAG: polymer-forming cytoskeletal protein [Gammaproteobacteria bacterium]|nr:polymer-forming cytoskeletal protein [Gammaproteobacteria bacterium]NVK88493.1 polymer-forming cytoskeletal protein [Gammaproteobacteria bacterium]
MFGKSKKNSGKVRAKAGAADTLITRDTKITGSIHFTGVLYVDGHVVGDIAADEAEMSLLTIGKHGVVEGQVDVPHVVILGRVEGDVYASEHIELESSAHVDGDVYYKLIEMAMGAEVNGKLVHREQKLLNHDKKAAATADKDNTKGQKVEAKANADAKASSTPSATH